MIRLMTILLIVAVLSVAEDSHREGRGDSYWDAYADSHGGGPTATGSDLHGPSAPSSLYDSPHGPSPGYNEPPGPYPGPRKPPHRKPLYQGPRGPPNPPSPVYGPGPIEPPYEPAFGGAPFSIPGHGLLDLDVATLCKILLKVLLFKAIVKFIAVICLLLFLPKLKEHKQSGNNGNCNSNNNSNNDDDGGDRSQGRSSSHLDALTALVWDSVDRNSTKYADIDEESCQRDIRCRIRRVAAIVDEKTTFPRLFSLFLHERFKDTKLSNEMAEESPTEKKPL